MIHIDKPDGLPRILRERGKRETQALCAAYEAGERAFQFRPDIYAARSVKNKLRKIQYDKCCFCESRISHISYGDVEHFRPKAGYRQHGEDTLSRPGYYWLAYEWQNLFLSCQLCNQRHKKNFFPLRNGSPRAENHHDDISEEEPLFINPAHENPEDYISFRQEVPYAINGNSKGRASIEALGLDRAELNGHRRELLALVRQLYFVHQHPDTSPDIREQIIQLLEQYVRDDAEYSAMIRANLKAGFSADGE